MLTNGQTDGHLDSFYEVISKKWPNISATDIFPFTVDRSRYLVEKSIKDHRLKTFRIP